MRLKSKILVIAGSDSSGGAGIQADIKTITALGSYAMTAITAVTSQNTTGINAISPISIEVISKQIEHTSKDIRPDAIKIGMLHSESVIKTVLRSLDKINVKKIILDPVMVAKGGHRLIDTKSIKMLKKKLLKRVTLITPNIPEAEVLSGIKIKTIQDMINAAKKIKILGAKNILIKGGHLETNKIHNVLLVRNKIKIFKSKKIFTKNTHGTGCTLASAITTFYSCGKTLNKSCELGINYVNHAIKNGPNYGKGHGPINHINNIKIINFK